MKASKALYLLLYITLILIVIWLLMNYSKSMFMTSMYERAQRPVDQDLLLSKMLSYTIDNVPFYTESLNGKEATLSNFPVINKRFIRDRQESMISRDSVDRRYMDSVSSANNSWTDKDTVKKDITVQEGIKMIYHILKGDSIAQTTGGSSGEYFYQWFSTTDFVDGLYSFVKGWVNMGWKPSDTIFLYYFHGANCVKLANHFQVPGFFAAVPSVDENGDITLESYSVFVEILETKKPELIVSFPSILYRVCQLAYENNYTFIHNPKCIDISADFLFTCQFDFIKSFFPRSDIRLTYGTIEFGQIAQQIPGRMFDYEIYDDVAIVEQGPKSNLIVTSLIYTTQPMIRYEIDDVGNVEYDALLKKHIIRGLVGKPATIDINYIELDSYVQGFNKTHDAYIINIRIDTKTKKVIVTTVSENSLQVIASYFNIGGLGYKTVPMLCKQASCKTVDRYDRKNTPVLKQYSKK